MLFSNLLQNIFNKYPFNNLVHNNSNKYPLSHLLQNTFNKYPLNHSFNIANIDDFIFNCHPSVRDISIKLLSNTIHIPFERFLIILNQNINYLLSTIKNFYRPIFILIDNFNNFNINDDTSYIYKSNLWIYNYIVNYIKFKTSSKLNIILIHNLISNSSLTNNDTVILIDDCIYSGLQMSDNIGYNLVNSKKLKLNIFILVPFISRRGIDTITELFNTIPSLKYYCNLVFSKYYHLIYPINSFLTSDEINLISTFYSGLLDFSNSYSIYFDHKLAYPISTITHFYLGFVPNNNNKKLFKKLSSILSKLFKNRELINMQDIHNFYKDFLNSNSFTIIPIINNCDKYINNIDIYSPKCPFPPYKKGFFNFIKKLDKKHNSLNNKNSLNKKHNSLNKKFKTF